ncbi:hypothetical protein [Rickettsiella massiliensis]|uniref:hypothetical protein n=1 Tax=Rickettsiella massiliensis TaxID=676517 RepID=UPI00029AD0A2|nr:hypothetical protein [Rickettsiella massiliensis]
MNGLWQEQNLRLIDCTEEKKIKALQKTTNMVCRYGRLIFFKKICTSLQKNYDTYVLKKCLQRLVEAAKHR